MSRAMTGVLRAALPFFFFFFFFFFSVCALITGSSCGSLDIRTSSQDTRTQDWTGVSRRSPGRPGSYPPRCIGKCGRCNPCRAVHVTVPPVIAEYYPEAWRCKCGDRLYIP